ncbi:MAG: hypothetical protein JWN56_2188 [Sphingobacteriales bacterium]|nr:hypothetical protein [Sphingobacteriales bacterium]
MSMKLPRNQRMAMAPKIFVITIWPIEPTAIAITPNTLFLGDKKNTLPPYSPIRFGVKTAHVNPQKTDSMDFHKLMRSIFLSRYFHFTASIVQLTSINKMMILTTITTFTKFILVARLLKFFRF